MEEKGRNHWTALLLKVSLAGCCGVLGNLLMMYVPWPAFFLKSYESSLPVVAGDPKFYLVILVLAPVAEEFIFRFGIYGFLKRFVSGWAACLISSLAFGIYHGNWIQGIYGFFFGILLAWGYENEGKPTLLGAVLMHSAANLAVLAVFGWPAASGG